MLERWKAMSRFRRARRLAIRGGCSAEVRTLCLEALEILSRVPARSFGPSHRASKLVLLGMVGASSLELGERERARVAFREWAALLAESRGLHPTVFDREDLLGGEWVRRKLELLEGEVAAARGRGAR